MTTAERIAEWMGNDGTVYELKDGRKLEELCDVEATSRTSWGDFARWAFDDDSVIVSYAICWDIGLSPNCWCMRGAGHADNCEVRQ